MFNSKDNHSNTGSHGAITAISAGTIIKGDLTCPGDIRIDGKVIGNLSCESKIIVGPNGLIEGDIKGNTAEIMGHIKGNISMVGQLNLIGKCIVDGDLHVAKLQIAADVQFNGKCSMGAPLSEAKKADSLMIHDSAQQ